MSPSDLQKIRRAAMDLLARREHSKMELNNKLVARFGSDPNILKVIEILSGEGLQSDERFVSTYIHSRARRTFGPAHIRNELRLRGIDAVAIETAINEAGIDWAILCKQLADKKFGSCFPLSYQEKARRIRFLVSRGFYPEHYSSLSKS